MTDETGKRLQSLDEVEAGAKQFAKDRGASDSDAERIAAAVRKQAEAARKQSQSGSKPTTGS